MELQDLNSPQHIADMYTEIYNREWASAYEELNQSYRDGAETIKHLLQILEVGTSVVVFHCYLILWLMSMLSYIYCVNGVLVVIAVCMTFFL